MKTVDPIKPQTPQVSKIKCATCKFRDKTTITIKGIVRPVGVTRGQCKIYSDSRGKPYDVLFENADCLYYEKDVE